LILAESLTHQRREPVASLSKIYGLGRYQDLHACRNRDHVAAFTARSTSRSQAGSIPGAARTTAPPISIVIGCWRISTSHCEFAAPS
jgi:hypothetical protein